MQVQAGFEKYGNMLSGVYRFASGAWWRYGNQQPLVAGRRQGWILIYEKVQRTYNCKEENNSFQAFVKIATPSGIAISLNDLRNREIEEASKSNCSLCIYCWINELTSSGSFLILHDTFLRIAGVNHTMVLLSSLFSLQYTALEKTLTESFRIPFHAHILSFSWNCLSSLPSNLISHIFSVIYICLISFLSVVFLPDSCRLISLRYPNYPHPDGYVSEFYTFSISFYPDDWLF